jgi:hypothetical protein
MPYINADEYEMVKHILNPQLRQGWDADEAERAIYALNRQIKGVPGTSPTAEWRNLHAQHDRLVAAYRQAGGNKHL